jgi:hypothetical protein
MAVTMLREAVDDLYRYRRDTEMNSTLYYKVTRDSVVPIRSSYVCHVSNPNNHNCVQ